MYQICGPLGSFNGKRNQIFLDGVASAVFSDLVRRNLPRLNAHLVHKYTWKDLPCPSICTNHPEIHAVFIDHDDTTRTVFLSFRKANDQNLSYEGFWPFGVLETDIALISLYVGLYLTLEFDRQYRQEWSMQAILRQYPDVDPGCMGDTLQRFGFEVLGYSPSVFQPPYNIVLAT